MATSSIATSEDNLIVALTSIWNEVLNISAAINVDDDFFNLGGDSISCILLIARIRNKLKLELNLEDVFKLRTLKNLSEHLGSQNTYSSPYSSSEVQNAGQVLSFPANGLLRDLLYDALKTEKIVGNHTVQTVHHYNSKIDPHCLNQAWQCALRKYPALRLHFEWKEKALQIIEEEAKPLNWYFEDLSDKSDLEAESRITELQTADRLERWQLTEGPLYRVSLIKQSDSRFILTFSCHRSIMDNWSLQILHDYVHSTYLCLVEGETVDVEIDTAYIAAQMYLKDHKDDFLGYWRQQIKRIDDRCDFTGLLNAHKRCKVNLSSYEHVNHKIKNLNLGINRTSLLKSLCANNHVTFHSVLQFVWHKVLNAIGNGQFTVVGTIVSGRTLPIEGIERSVGMFINTLPLIVDHAELEVKSIIEAITDIQTTVNKMNSRCILELQNGITKSTLFDTLMVLENCPNVSDKRQRRCYKKVLNFDHAINPNILDYPLSIVSCEEYSELVVNLWYANELFDDKLMQMLLDSVETLIDQVIRVISIPVQQLELCSQNLLSCFESWNQTEEIFDDKITLHEIFEQVAIKYSSSVAVVFNDVQLSYGQLNCISNQLANHLHEIDNLRPNDIIALVLNRSEKMIIAILAVWKSGTAYVPIDPRYPDERISFILEDTKARVILTNMIHFERMKLLTKPSQSVLDIDSLSLETQSCDAPTTRVSSSDLAYLIYTSGTTGTPKAVMVEHRGVVNLHVSRSKQFSLSKDFGNEALLNFANYIFDQSLIYITDVLLNGQKLVMLDDGMLDDMERLMNYIAKQEVTFLEGTPSVLSLYDYSNASSITRIESAGEDLAEFVFNKIRGSFNGTIVNSYGPTEVSIITHSRLYGVGEERLNRSIGRPVANTKCYVLSRYMKRLPIGGIGELYIGGNGVTRGYLNQDNLTAERFLENPFQTIDEAQNCFNDRIYKTGDLVRWLPNGELEYLGRSDFQVKIRGYRIELEEIEAVLTSYSGVSRSVVIAREHHSKDTVYPQKYLVGFCISDTFIDEQDVKRFMHLKLPTAVVPSRIIRIDNIPLTANGKLDIKQLPDTDFSQPVNAEYVAPSSSIEVKLCQMWSEVLDISPECISVHDDFFSLGGDSLRAIHLVQYLRNSFGNSFPFWIIFKSVNIRDQSLQMEQLLQDSGIDDFKEFRKSISENANYGPVSSRQSYSLFIDGLEETGLFYNCPYCLEFQNCTIPQQEIIKYALNKLLCRHPALRTLIKIGENNEYIQQVLNEKQALDLFRISESTVKDNVELDKTLIKNSMKKFHLDKELPIRAWLIRCQNVPETIYLSIIFHHVCFDDWSFDIFHEELYRLVLGVQEENLVQLKASYIDFAKWVQIYPSDKILFQLCKFWTKYLEDSEPAQLPLNWPRTSKFDHFAKKIHFTVNASTTDVLKALAKSSRVTLYSVLLGAYSLMVNIFSGQNDFVIATPYANREQLEFRYVIGYFANLLAIRIKIDHTVTIREYIRSVGSSVIAAQIHNGYSYTDYIRCLKIKDDPNCNHFAFMLFGSEIISVYKKLRNTVQTLTTKPYRPNNNDFTMTIFDTNATVEEVDGQLLVNFIYASSLFSEDCAQKFVSCFQHLLIQFAKMSQLVDVIKVSDSRFQNFQ